MICAGCQTEVAPALLSCPVCHGLVHAGELKRLAREAEAAEADRPTEALAAWRRVLDLLPPGSRQAEAVAGKVEALGRRVEAMPAGGGERRSFRGVWKAGGWIAAAALLLWKLKAIVLVVLSKGKLLLLGLTKMGTLSTMLLSAGVYWGAFGWKLAFGLVASIYVHEMGHVAALRRFGIPASAPMFIPGIGAFVRLRQRPASPREDARVGLAGPLWGLAAAVAAWGVHLLGGGAVWAAIAKWGALINLFNLLPLWGLDGGRGFHALSRGQKIFAAAALGVLWAATREGLLILLLILAVLQAFSRREEGQGDRLALAQYVFLAAVLSAMCRIEVPGV